MNIKTCRHCDIRFYRPDAAPIPHDRCERCHEEVEAMKAQRYNPVTRPAHYQSDEGIECIDAIRAALGLEGFVAHCRGTAIKYAWRAGSKGDAAECLRKGAWYLERAAQELEQ